MKVDFFIVGAPKAGTSSIYNMLNNHSSACMSIEKEPNYFSQNEVATLYTDANYQSGLMKYENEEQYHEQFFDLEKTCGEASVSYLIYPGMAQKIYSYNPSAKIIICLRDPVERAISHYRMDRRLGFTDKTLLQIVDREEGTETEYFQYIEGSIYAPQIEPYLKVFKKNQLMIIEFKDMIENPKEYAHEIQRFLGLPLTLDTFPHENTGFDTSNKILAFMYRSRKIRDLGKAIVPRVVINKFKELGAMGKQNVSEDLYSRLHGHMKHDVNDLERILGREFKRWNSF